MRKKKLRVLVIDAGNVSEGVQIAERNSPHVVVLDLDLPDRTAMTLAQRFRRNRALRSCYLLGLTATGVTPAQAFAAGLDQLLTKPAEPKVIDSILEHCRRSMNVAE